MACGKGQGLGSVGGVLSVPGALDFGTVGLGSATTLSLVLGNTGTGVLTVSAVALAGDGSFAAPNQPLAIAPGQSASLAVTFAPQAVGSKSAVLTLTDDAATSTTQVMLSGTAYVIGVTVVPASLDLGTVALGATSAPGSLTLTSTASVGETLSVAVGGADATDFHVQSPSTPYAVDAGASLTLALVFTPSRAALEAAEPDLLPCAGCATVAVPLSGTGAQTTLHLTPAAIAFGPVPTGDTVLAAVQVTAQTLPANATAFATALGAPLLETADAGFALWLDGGWPAQLGPGQSATAYVAFTSAQGDAGERGLVSFPFSVEGLAQPAAMLALSAGLIVSPCTGLTATPAALSFGTIDAGESATKTVTLKNGGAVACDISQIAIAPNDGDGDFAVPGATPAPVAPGATLGVSVTFAPSSAQSPTRRQATLAISNNSASTLDIPLTGDVSAVNPGTTSGTSSGTVSGTSGGSTGGTSGTSSGGGLCTVTVIAGSDAGFVDGPGGPTGIAKFSSDGISSITIGPKGDLYVSDGFNEAFRKISPSHDVTTLAGTGTFGYADGTGGRNGTALFGLTDDLLIGDGGSFFLFDESSLRLLDAQNNVTTLAGGPFQGTSNGRGSAAQFKNFESAVLAPSGTIYFTNGIPCAVRQMDPSGNVTTFAGSGTCGYKDGPPLTAEFNGQTALALDSTGNLYVADNGNCAIRQVDVSGNVSTYFGGSCPATVGFVLRMTFDAAGNLFVSDGYSTIKKIDPTGVVTSVCANIGFLARAPNGHFFGINTAANTQQVVEIVP